MHRGLDPGVALSSLAARGVAGGVLMGLANLVPGISGGTMLLAVGIYPRFIGAIADVTRLRFRRPSWVVLGSVVGAAGVAILGLAGLVRDLVVAQRWMAYALFIGLTLGGVPVVWRLIRDRSAQVAAAAVVSFVVMAAVAWAQISGEPGAGTGDAGLGIMVFAGVAGASAMILPGVSGGYLLLLMGVYVPILSAVSAFKDGLAAGNLSIVIAPLAEVILPVGLGVVVGVVVVSNALQWLLARYEQVTLGALLGLLVGAVVGLWPFQVGVAPSLGSVFKGRVVTPARLQEIEPEAYPTHYFDPTVGQVTVAVAIALAGFLITLGIARLGQLADDSARWPGR